jgi:hypothetical protein
MLILPWDNHLLVAARLSSTHCHRAAAAATAEVGHHMGLSHDGLGYWVNGVLNVNETYYSGHNDNMTSWAPVSITPLCCLHPYPSLSHIPLVQKSALLVLETPKSSVLYSSLLQLQAVGKHAMQLPLTVLGLLPHTVVCCADTPTAAAAAACTVVCCCCCRAWPLCCRSWGWVTARM